MVEHLHNNPRLHCRALFATHYHELTDLAATLPGVRNYRVAMSEDEGRIAFLRRIVPGGADRSYGVHVAMLAGMPPAVVSRAQELLAELENGTMPAGPAGPPAPGPNRPAPPAGAANVRGLRRAAGRRPAGTGHPQPYAPGGH